jgi:hypothetical protein
MRKKAKPTAAHLRMKLRLILRKIHSDASLSSPVSEPKHIAIVEVFVIPAGLEAVKSRGLALSVGNRVRAQHSGQPPEVTLGWLTSDF